MAFLRSLSHTFPGLAATTSLIVAEFLPVGLAQLEVQVSIADCSLNGSTDGSLEVMFPPQGGDLLKDTVVTSSPS